ncbi:MAG: hypothetical protein COB17_05545 [Sulfurimonas sp.]|nr:MAG: hypothetical protein COB17_05545 [Sulfurimonas sp.]
MNKEIENMLYREDISLAPIKKRLMAFFIDEMLLSLLLIVALWDSFRVAITVQDMIILTNTFVLEYMVMKIMYQTFFTMKYGASIGKLTMKIRVIEIKTLSYPSVVSSLNRAIIRVVSEMIFYLGFLWGMMDPARQSWHDKTAKTLVVNV